MGRDPIIKGVVRFETSQRCSSMTATSAPASAGYDAIDACTLPPARIAGGAAREREGLVSRLRVPYLSPMVIALLAFLSTAGALAQDVPQPDDSPLRVAGAVTPPEKISGAPPVYPETARMARVSGTVIVQAIIDEHGDVTDVKVLKGLPMGLDQAAVEAVKIWKFKPSTLLGRPVKVYYVLTVNFQIEDDPPLGPRLQKFLEAVPGFEEHLRAKRYTEAAQLLDSAALDWPGGPEIPLARCYLLLRQDRLDDAWEDARSYRGPDPYEMLYLVGAYAWYRATHNGVLNLEARAAVVDLGLQAEDMALEAKTDGLEATMYKALLLLEKAHVTPDRDERLALAKEAMQLQRQAMKMLARARQN